MIDMQALQAKLVMDENGKKTAVIPPIREFEELLEDLEDLAVMAGKARRIHHFP
jgi:hypothetical protein